MGEKTSKALRLPLLQGRYKMDPVLHQHGAGLLCHNRAARPQGRVPATGQPEAEVTWQHGGGGQPRGPLGHRATAWAPAWEVPSWGALGGPGANGRGGLGRGSRAAERKGVLTLLVQGSWKLSTNTRGVWAFWWLSDCGGHSVTEERHSQSMSHTICGGHG